MPVNARYKTYLADQREFHDAVITEDWDTYASADWDETRRYEISQLFGIIQPRKVIDIGCGCGFHDVEMAQHPFVERVDAIDPSAASITRANEHFNHVKIRRWVAGIADLAPDREYDLAISIDVFEHLNNPGFYLDKMREILRPGGYAAIITPNRHRWSNVVRILKFQKPALMSVMHWHEYTIAEIFKLSRKHGLRPAYSFGYGLEGPIVSRLSHPNRLRLGRRLPSIAHGMCVILQNP